MVLQEQLDLPRNPCQPLILILITKDPRQQTADKKEGLRNLSKNQSTLYFSTVTPLSTY